MIDHEHSGFGYQTEDFKNHDTLLVTDSIGSICFLLMFTIVDFHFHWICRDMPDKNGYNQLVGRSYPSVVGVASLLGIHSTKLGERRTAAGVVSRPGSKCQ